ncbi:MAG: hypothetical protein Q4C59_05640 [Lachnospiraceae bacterium]|nr:hypothetical protein [Lachnospiraceae bacterium]
MVILDEPTNHLDSGKLVEELYQIRADVFRRKDKIYIDFEE